MADQLLSIEDSSLTAIANAIRSKGGTNSSLEFPTDFVTALQAITTEATVTPKIAAQQKVLTPSETQFAISAGFHDGTGTVSVQTQSKNATPTSSQQTIYPDSGYFLSSVAVAGIGNGTQVVTGTTTPLSNSNTLVVSNLTFDPKGIVVMIIADPSYKAYLDRYTSAIFAPFETDFNPNSNGTGTNNVSGATYGSSYYSTFSHEYGKATLTYCGSQRFTGTFKYIVWG